ncbi:MAG: outer membrane lipoprotein-sorting protein [Methanosarcinales archaeon]
MVNSLLIVKMKRFRRKRIIIWLSILILLLVQEIKGVDINEIIKNAQEQYKSQEEYLKNYSFSAHLTAKAMNKSGKVLWDESGEQEIYVKEGKKYTEIITWIKNGKLLSQKELKKKEEKMNKDIKEVKKEVSYWPFKPGIEKYYLYKLLGEEEVNEYHAYKINVIPKKKDKKQEFYEGNFWLDTKTYGVVKAVFTTTKLPKLHKKMKTEENYKQIQSAIWLPISKFIKSEVSAIIYEVDVEMKITYFDYKIN